LLWPLAGQDRRDARLDYVLFLLSARSHRGEATQRLETALAHADLPVQLRCDGLQSLARVRAGAGRYGEAVDLLHQLTRLRRQADDWLLLGQYEQARNQPAQAIEALESAVRINTWLPDVHRSLMQFYQRQGNLDRASWHQARAGIR
jgi:tetratricopeptide (TPR) repeat protein